MMMFHSYWEIGFLIEALQVHKLTPSISNCITIENINEFGVLVTASQQKERLPYVLNIMYSISNKIDLGCLRSTSGLYVDFT